MVVEHSSKVTKTPNLYYVCISKRHGSVPTFLAPQNPHLLNDTVENVVPAVLQTHQSKHQMKVEHCLQAKRVAYFEYLCNNTSYFGAAIPNTEYN